MKTIIYKTIFFKKTIKLLEKNREKKCLDIGLGNDFLGTTPKAQAKTNKQNYIKLKTSVQQRKINKIKRQPMERDKIFANHLSDKG